MTCYIKWKPCKLRNSISRSQALNSLLKILNANIMTSFKQKNIPMSMSDSCQCLQNNVCNTVYWSTVRLPSFFKANKGNIVLNTQTSLIPICSCKLNVIIFHLCMYYRIKKNASRKKMKKILKKKIVGVKNSCIVHVRPKDMKRTEFFHLSLDWKMAKVRLITNDRIQKFKLTTSKTMVNIDTITNL